MSTSKELRVRGDVDNADIPEIIGRAERLRQKFVEIQEAKQNLSSIEDVQTIGSELSIPPRFVEQAIRDLRQERLLKRKKNQRAKEKKQNAVTTVSKAIRLVGLLVGVMVVLRAGEWLWHALDMTSDTEQINNTQTEVVVVERVLPSKEPSIVQIDKGVNQDAAEPSTEVQVVDTVTDVGMNSDKTRETLLWITEALEGEWVLDAYLLYEKGVRIPMIVPVIYEPLELPKTWRFSNGSYKRVMDAKLGFSARFEVTTLPEDLKPKTNEQGEWAQLVASNVVSTIPGIQRQNDYFAILVSKEALTIWYLGPNTYRKKIPSQAEAYRRR